MSVKVIKNHLSVCVCECVCALATFGLARQVVAGAWLLEVESEVGIWHRVAIKGKVTEIV